MKMVLMLTVLLRYQSKITQMKKTFLTAFIVLAAVSVRSQDCKTCYYFDENATIETKTTLADGSLKESEMAKASRITSAGGQLNSFFTSVKYDKKGKPTEPQTAKIKCDKDGLRISFQMPVMDDGQQPKEMYLYYPNVMKVGQKLESEVEFVIKGKVKGKKMDVTFKITDRKVVGPARIATPMGNKDCIKISFDMDVKFKVLGIGMPMKLQVNEWYAPGFGIVKTEAYRDGKLEETSIITVKK